MRRIILVVAIMMAGLAVPAIGLSQDLVVSEQQAMADTFQYALENNSGNQTSDWVNPDTGHAGTVTPVQTYEAAGGQPCREFITTIIVGGREEQGYGTACRQPDGTWQVASSQTRQTEISTPATAEVIPVAGYSTVRYGYPTRHYYGSYGYPAGYYAYPAGFYGSSPIYLSFSYVYRSGHRHQGNLYLDGRSFRNRHPVQVHKRVFIGPRIYDRHPWYYRGPDRHHFNRQPVYRGHQDRRGYQDRRGHRPDVWRNPGHDRNRRHR
jgi:surface antigen